MKDEERAKLWRTLRVAAAILGTLCVVYGFYVNQVIWTAASAMTIPGTRLAVNTFFVFISVPPSLT